MDAPSADAPATLAEVGAALAARLLETMPAGGSYDRAALARLPEPVEHILAAALDRRVARETALPATPWIDADEPEVRDAARRWREASRDAARYPPDAWAPALAEAADHSLRHLVDPAEASAAFCFAGETAPLPMATVRARLGAFGPYSYLREIAARYAERKELEAMDRAGLVALLRRIDKRMTSSYGAAEWSALAAPLFSLVGSMPSLGGRVPADLLQRFFAARGAGRLADAMATRPAWSPEEMQEVLTALLAAPSTPAGSETVVLESALVSVFAPAPPSERTPTVPPVPARTDEPPAPRPIWQALAQAAPAPVEPPTADEAEPLWQALARSPPVAARADVRPEPLAPLEARVLGADALAQRDLFVSAIAGGSEAAYRRLLETLDEAGSWEQAWPIIGEAFRAGAVDIYGDAAVAFTDAAEGRFGQG